MKLRERTVTSQAQGQGPHKRRKSKAVRKLPTRHRKATQLVCPRTQQRIPVISSMPPEDIQHAMKRKQSPFPNPNEPRLILIHHPQIRQQVYNRHAQEWQRLESAILPTYGGRQWHVQVTITDPATTATNGSGSTKKAATKSSLTSTSSPYFCFQRHGQLELAAWACMVQNIPKLKERLKTCKNTHVPDIPTVTNLSLLAYNHKHLQPLPIIQVKWTSPLREQFTNRQQAYDRAMELVRQEHIINRALEGYDERQRPLKVTPCGKTLALKAGKLRFERDGLWIVGQEDEWRYQRALEQGIRPEPRKSSNNATLTGSSQATESRRKMSPLLFFLQCRREEYRRERLEELRQEARRSNTILGEQMTPISSIQPSLSNEDKASVPNATPDQENGHQTTHTSNPLQAVVQQSGSTPNNTGVHESFQDKQPLELSATTVLPSLVSATTLVHGNHPLWKHADPANTLLSTDHASPGPFNSVTQPSTPMVATLVSDLVCSPIVTTPKPDAPLSTKNISAPSKVSFTLQKADSELRKIWKVMSKEERAVWEQKLAAHEAEMKATTKNEETVAFSKKELDTSVTTSVLLESTTSPQESSPSEKVEGAVSPSPVNEPRDGTVCHQDENGNSDDYALSIQNDEGQEDLDYIRANLFAAPVPSSFWCLTKEQVELCYDAGMDHYDQIMRTVQARDLVRELRDGFDLLRERGRGRFDMELPAFDEPRFSFFTDIKKAPWMPIVHQILGKDAVLIHKGMFLSMPGAEKQEYHQDGVHLSTHHQKPCHAINVFVPLVDLTMKNGPTHFCLGSHILDQDGYEVAFAQTPLVKAGTPVIFDYRLGHYGLANTDDTCRPILYCTYAAAAGGKEFRDSVNFSRRRYHRIGDLVTRPADSREERASKRRRVYTTSITNDDEEPTCTLGHEVDKDIHSL